MGDAGHITRDDLEVVVQTMLNRLQTPPPGDSARKLLQQVMIGEIRALMATVREVIGEDPVAGAMLIQTETLLFLQRPWDALLKLQILLTTDRPGRRVPFQAKATLIPACF